MAGGTGGHIFSALAIARALRRQGVEVHWLGTDGELEEKVVAPEFPLNRIQIKAFRGEGLLWKCLMPFRLAKALLQTYRIIYRLRPGVIFGMGSYVTGPGGLVAWLTRIPLLIHEQNSVVGLTNRMLAVISKSVMQAFPNTFPKNPKVMTTGNPIRVELLNIPLPQTRFAVRQGPLRILVLGGSQGARSINQKIMRALHQYPRSHEIMIWHQTGLPDYQVIRDDYQKILIKAQVNDFIEDMASAYAWADLIVCRSGALTVSEIAAVGVASIFIPYPYAVDNHQFYNGRFLEQAGAAIILLEKSLTEVNLIHYFEQFAHHRNRLVAMAERARNLAQPNAVHHIIAECEKHYVVR
ncbi:UDP-N-acetylglucosamine--N-acetylmuramyl-(pentapeptide) pyrophosphoryl-undecaprenol N-acetylglucosamine transferase [Coxiella endosymbiont of Amblyomma nuttalli]|nr:UDP-N-acetylglucosamine--N-acetylmuramyl-(pentapeptide) pyrophosphoryl-undecaprenol N-acetylglucosamine transferase [Coxiella endosymbiont of Amblyomma nuttalli]